jgi:hypothetical protein
MPQTSRPCVNSRHVALTSPCQRQRHPAANSVSRPRAQSRREAAGSQSSLRHELEQSQLYSEELAIDLSQGSEAVYFRWFLASLLFGARISETTAKHTYQSFIHHGLNSPRKVVAAGWDFLVNTVMREGRYVRYDGRKSTQILRDCQMLIDDYGGSLRKLHDSAPDPRSLEEKLLAFYGIGPVTLNIFLRELRPFWPNSNPDPMPDVEKLARHLSIDLSAYARKSRVFARVEAGLIRRRHELAAKSH